MAVRSKKGPKQKSLVHLDEAQMKDMQKYCKNIIRLSSNNIKILSKESSEQLFLVDRKLIKNLLRYNQLIGDVLLGKPENPTDVHVETAPSTSSTVVLKTEDSDAKSPDSSISSDELVLENGAIALSSSSHSTVQDTPIPVETSNPDRPPDGIVKFYVYIFLNFRLNN